MSDREHKKSTGIRSRILDRAHEKSDTRPSGMQDNLDTIVNGSLPLTTVPYDIQCNSTVQFC